MSKAATIRLFLIAATAGLVAAPVAAAPGLEPGAAGADRAAEVGAQPSGAALEQALAAARALEAADDGLRADFAAAARDVAEGDAIIDFFAARGFEPFWTAGDRATALLDALETADRHGLPVARYAPERLSRLLADIDAGPERPGSEELAAAEAAAEVALTEAYLRYGRDLGAGILTPHEVDPEITLQPEAPSSAELLAALEAEPLGDVLAGLAPATAEYEALMAEKARLMALAREGGWGAPVPAGEALRLGDTGPRVAALRERLARMGYPSAPEEAASRPGAGAAVAGVSVATDALPAEAAEVAQAAAEADPAERPAADRFDAALAAAVEAFQRDHGLHDDGIVGTQTLAALNASPEERIGQILVNLERIRWMPDDLGARHIWVNIPAYTVSVFEDEARVYHTRSIVGEARETRTPEFSDKMTYLVVNPTWYIPDSIAKRVYLPQLRQDPSVLRRNDMRLFTRAGTEIDPALVDFAALGDTFPFRVRQNPSPGNALGRVKFMFPNQFSIYLHDTPDRHLFGRDVRALSNGCVRLEDPFELAYYLLAPQLEDPEAAFRTWLDAGSERYVTLEEPIAVHIVYRTAWADADGVHFRSDIYGRDARVLEALVAQGVAAPGA